VNFDAARWWPPGTRSVRSPTGKVNKGWMSPQDSGLGRVIDIVECRWTGDPL
jgi:hypothetical protein